MKLEEGENKVVELHVCFYGYADSKIRNCWHFSKNGEERDVRFANRIHIQHDGSQTMSTGKAFSGLET